MWCGVFINPLFLIVHVVHFVWFPWLCAVIAPTIAPHQLFDIMAQRESGLILLCFSASDANYVGRASRGCSCRRSLLSSSETWTRPHNEALRYREALRRCLPLSQLCAIRRQTIKLLWNVWEDSGGHSRVTQFRQICCQEEAVTQKPFQKGHSIHLPGGFESVLTPLVCWNRYVLNCHWGAKCRRKRTWNSVCAANVPWNSSWGHDFYPRRPLITHVQNQDLTCYKRTDAVKSKGGTLFPGQPPAKMTSVCPHLLLFFFDSTEWK